MKKYFFLFTVLSLTLSACMPALPAIFRPEAANSPIPTSVSDADLQATAAVISQQTLEALSSPTLAPSHTPVVSTNTSTPTQPTPTETVNPILLTLTATLGTGTVTAGTTTPGTPGTPGTSTSTPNPAFSATPTETLHPQLYGTMPPSLPSGYINLINESRAEVYVSLQCTTKDGFVTIIEYPVGRRVATDAPAGEYIYVVWVGGNKITGEFGLGASQTLTMTIFKDRVAIKSKL